MSDCDSSSSSSDGCNCPNLEYVIYVSLIKENGPEPFEKRILISLQFITLKCKCIREKYTEEFLDDFGEFFDKILNYDYGFKNLYGFVFALYGLDDGYYKDISKKLPLFRKNCEKYCIKHKLPYIFINKSLLNISATLFATDLSLNDGEIVTVVHLTHEKSVEFDSENKRIAEKNIIWLTVAELQWKGSAYEMIKWQKIDIGKKDREEVKAIIMSDKNFKKLIITANSPTPRLKPFRDFIKSKKRIIIENGYETYLPDVISTMIEDIRGNTINKFKVIPCSLNTLDLEKMRIGEKWMHKIAEFPAKMLLPYESIFEVNSYDSDSYYFLITEANDFRHCFECWSLYHRKYDDIKYHTAKITIKIETDGFFTTLFEPIIGPYFRTIPPSINPSTIVKICLSNWNSYIWIQDIGRLKDADHETSFPMAISFHGDPIIIGDRAENEKTKYPKFVVSDLLYMLEMATYGNEKYPLESFVTYSGNTVKKDKNGTLFAVFETLCGQRRATPQKLLAGFIKALLNLATQNIGFEPENVQVWIRFNSAKIEAIKKEIAAAMNLLNVSNYNIVDKF